MPPAATGTSTGVSTSMKPRPSMKRRSALTRLLRITAMRIASSLEIRSRYLWRKRASTSARPCHFSGRGRSDLLSTVHSSASTVTSPVRVRNSGPDAPTQSPMSMSESVSYESGRLFFLRRTCIFPWPSWRPRNVALPIPLRRTMRPATETGPVLCPLAVLRLALPRTGKRPRPRCGSCRRCAGRGRSPGRAGPGAYPAGRAGADSQRPGVSLRRSRRALALWVSRRGL